MVGEWYLYKRICQIWFLSVRTGEAAKTHALYLVTKMRIICSQKVQGQGWRHLIPQRNRESLKALMMSHVQGRGHAHVHSPSSNPSRQVWDRSHNMWKWVRAQHHSQQIHAYMKRLQGLEYFFFMTGMWNTWFFLFCLHDSTIILLLSQFTVQICQTPPNPDRQFWRPPTTP